MTEDAVKRAKLYERLVRLLAIILLIAVVGITLYIQYLYGHYDSYHDFLDRGRVYLLLALIEIAASLWAIAGRSLPFLLSSSALLIIGIVSENRDAEPYLTIAFSTLFIAYFELTHLSIKLSHTGKEEGAENRPFVVRTYLRSLAVILTATALSLFISERIHEYLAGYRIAMLRTVYGFMLASGTLFIILLAIRYVLRHWGKTGVISSSKRR